MRNPLDPQPIGPVTQPLEMTHAELEVLRRLAAYPSMDLKWTRKENAARESAINKLAVAIVECDRIQQFLDAQKAK